MKDLHIGEKDMRAIVKLHKLRYVDVDQWLEARLHWRNMPRHIWCSQPYDRTDEHSWCAVGFGFDWKMRGVLIAIPPHMAEDFGWVINGE